MMPNEETGAFLFPLQEVRMRYVSMLVALVVVMSLASVAEARLFQRRANRGCAASSQQSRPAMFMPVARTPIRSACVGGSCAVR